MSDSLKDRPLHDVVEGLFLEHKHDIHLYCHGHLNHKNLYTPPDKATHTPWTSSSKEVPIPVMRQPTKMPSPKKSLEKDKAMKEAIYDFSMGTAGSLPLQETPALGSPAKGTKDRENHMGHEAPILHSPGLESRTTFSSPSLAQSRQHNGQQSIMTPLQTPMSRLCSRERQQSQQRHNSVASYVADNVYIEELRLPELMLPVSQNRNHKRSNSPSALAPISGVSHDAWHRHQFVETHLGGITKQDQFNRFRDFQSGILKTSEMFEKGVLSGRKAVEHLEKRLCEDLLGLDDVYRQSGPNFHRLQIYNNAWQSLMEDSPIFKDILTDIKTEYDIYMGSLLDTQPQKQSQLLCQQVDNLAAGSPVVPGEVKEGQKHVQKLEASAKELLAENDRLREHVKTEREQLQNQPPPSHKVVPRSATKARSSKKDEKPSSVAEQILELHAGILVQIEELAELRCELQQNYVPVTVCHHLDQCVRDTEAEVLKVLSTNEYLEKTIQQLEVDIERLMERGNTPDTDTRQIWKSINTLSLVSGERL